MKKLKFKYSKCFFVLLMLSVITAGIILVDNYLKVEKLFFYKTGTDKKAILNSTWNMSAKEVERANKTKLDDEYTFVLFDDELNKLLDPDRITAKINKTMNLWAHTSELTYDFFDDRLFRYRLIGQVDEPAKFDSIVKHNLYERYGDIKRNNDKFGGTFLKDSVFVKYSQFDVDGKNNTLEHRFLIEVTYQPLFIEISKVARAEQSSIFK